MNKISTSPATSAEPSRSTILTGDALTVMRRLPTSSIDQVFFSPPYFRLRDYGIGQAKGELGQEDTVDQWVDHLLAICAEAKRILVSTGGLWLNLGDTYSDHPRRGAARKSLLLGPERLALQLTRQGWLCRNNIVWAKANHMPSSARDKLTSAWEHLYFFTKQARYFFDLDAIRQPHISPMRPRQDSTGPANRHDPTRPNNPHHTSGIAALKSSGLPGHPLGKNPSDVWTIPASSGVSGHMATMPVELARRAIAAGCPETRCTNCHAPYIRDPAKTRCIAQHLGYTAVGSLPPRPGVPLTPTCSCHSSSEPGLVLDPFIGSGTTGIAAQQLQRDWLGIEINPAYARQAKTRIDQANSASKGKENI